MPVTRLIPVTRTTGVFGSNAGVTPYIDADAGDASFLGRQDVDGLGVLRELFTLSALPAEAQSILSVVAGVKLRETVDTMGAESSFGVQVAAVDYLGATGGTGEVTPVYVEYTYDLTGALAWTPALIASALFELAINSVAVGNEVRCSFGYLDVTWDDEQDGGSFLIS